MVNGKMLNYIFLKIKMKQAIKKKTLRKKYQKRKKKNK